jgi:hypothetical protein
LRRPVINTFVAGIPELVHWLAGSGRRLRASCGRDARMSRRTARPLIPMYESARRQALARHNIDTESNAGRTIYASNQFDLLCTLVSVTLISMTFLLLFQRTRNLPPDTTGRIRWTVQITTEGAGISFAKTFDALALKCPIWYSDHNPRRRVMAQFSEPVIICGADELTPCFGEGRPIEYK